MRGGVSVDEVFAMSFEERNIISEIIKENLETTKKTGQPFFQAVAFFLGFAATVPGLAIPALGLFCAAGNACVPFAPACLAT